MQYRPTGQQFKHRWHHRLEKNQSTKSIILKLTQPQLEESYFRFNNSVWYSRTLKRCSSTAQPLVSERGRHSHTDNWNYTAHGWVETRCMHARMCTPAVETPSMYLPFEGSVDDWLIVFILFLFLLALSPMTVMTLLPAASSTTVISFAWTVLVRSESISSGEMLASLQGEALKSLPDKRDTAMKRGFKNQK